MRTIQGDPNGASLGGLDHLPKELYCIRMSKDEVVADAEI